MKSTMTTTGICLAVLAALALAGCATSGATGETNSLESSFVYGKIDLSPMDDQLTLVSALRHPYKTRAYMGAVTDVRFTVLTDGSFFAENVEPGQYFIYYVNGARQPWSGKINAYYLQDMNPRKVDLAAVFTVPAQEIVYLGAFQFEVGEKGGLLGNKPVSFTLAPQQNVNETDVLKGLLPFVKKAAWQQEIQNKLGL